MSDSPELLPQTWIDWYPEEIRQTYARLDLVVTTEGELLLPPGTSDAEVDEFVVDLRAHWDAEKERIDQKMLTEDPINYLFG